MMRWKLTVDIKPIIGEDQANTAPEHVASVANRIAKKMRDAVPDNMRSISFEDAVEWMESATPDDANVIEFNAALSDLYDWADRERVWLGI